MSDWVIYWERFEQRGFVSYSNDFFKRPKVQNEYEPVDLQNASEYKTKGEAERIAGWYRSRGGFGNFTVMKRE